MPVNDQTSAKFLGSLRDLAQGFLDWSNQEGAEGHHPPSPQQHSQALQGGDNVNQPPPMPQQNAAGMLLLAPDGRALFVRRAAHSRDHAGQWSIPGGMTEGDELPWQTAQRETTEEVGDCGVQPDHMQLLDHSVGDTGVGFTTFGGRTSDAFRPKLSDEHDGYQWAPIKTPPQPLHPGLKATLDFAQDPLTSKGEKIMRSMQSQYGPEKGKSVFYASKNAGRISGVDNGAASQTLNIGNAPGPFSANIDQTLTAPSGGVPAMARRKPEDRGVGWNQPQWRKPEGDVGAPGRPANPAPAQPAQAANTQIPGRTQDAGGIVQRFKLLDTATGQQYEIDPPQHAQVSPDWQGPNARSVGGGAKISAGSGRDTGGTVGHDDPVADQGPPPATIGAATTTPMHSGRDAFGQPAGTPQVPVRQAPRQGMGMRQPLAPRTPAMNAGMQPKFTHSMKMQYPDGTVDERRMVRPGGPPATVDAGVTWGTPNWS